MLEIATCLGLILIVLPVFMLDCNLSFTFPVSASRRTFEAMDLVGLLQEVHSALTIVAPVK